MQNISDSTAGFPGYGSSMESAPQSTNGHEDSGALDGSEPGTEFPTGDDFDATNHIGGTDDDSSPWKYVTGIGH